mgnify:CR=1 FL=1
MRNWFYLNAAIVAVSCLGCGGSAGLDGLVKASGTVTYQGKPVEGATVSFRPVNGKRAASGRTDAQGRFHLTSLHPGDGAFPGAYKVAISKIEDTDPAHQVTAEEFAAMVAGGKAPPREPARSGAGKSAGGLVYHIPEKYLDADKSALTAEVTASGENDFVFDLN